MSKLYLNERISSLTCESFLFSRLCVCVRLTDCEKLGQGTAGPDADVALEQSGAAEVRTALWDTGYYT